MASRAYRIILLIWLLSFVVPVNNAYLTCSASEETMKGKSGNVNGINV